MPLEEFKALVASSETVADILKGCGLKNGHHIVYHRISEENIDDSHIRKGLDSRKGRTFDEDVKARLELVLTGKLKYKVRMQNHLKPKLFKFGFKKEQCEECGQGPTHNGKPLVLQLDHVDGDPLNNLLKNLRVMCPNCHTQTDTFCRPKSNN